MFYSHEVLTQRKYGVATIWLVATLGSKSILKKVNRKDILSVNVPKACQTVIQPDAPLALRLQSNLLYGISRVYSGQCDYLISDAAMAQTNIKRLISSTSIRAANLDLISGGRARPEHLVLTDDPAFLPDINLAALPDGIELLLDGGNLFTLDDSLGLSSLSFDRASSIFSEGHIGSRVGSAPGSPGPNFMIPTSDTMAGDYGFMLEPPAGVGEAEDRFLDDVDFEFDANGEMRELELPLPPRDRDSLASGRAGSAGLSRMRRAGSMQSIGQGSRLNSEDLAEQVLLEHQKGRGDGLGRSREFDGDNTFSPEDNVFDISGVEPLPEGSKEPSSEAAEDAPVRRRRVHNKVVIVDSKTELRNAELKDWRDNYLSNMETAIKRSIAGKLSRKAKSNANIVVFGHGFFGELRNPVLKSLFSAKVLLDIINQTNDGVEGARKRKKAASFPNGKGGIDGEDEEGRRVRARSEGLGEGMALGNPADEYELPMGRPGEDGLEIGREGPDLVSDGIRPSSQAALPWNVMSAGRRSRAGSLMSGGLLPSVGGFPSSSVGGSQMDFPARRGSRISAIRGGLERLSVLGSPIGERDEETLGELDQELLPGEEMEFEYFGAGANVDTQTAQDSQWLAATVEQESTNFFEFVKTEHTKRKQQAENDNEEALDFITFDQLLNPAENGKIVAAQAFHHTLLLATKGLVYVSQEENYGSIQISIL